MWSFILDLIQLLLIGFLFASSVAGIRFFAPEPRNFRHIQKHYGLFGLFWALTFVSGLAIIKLIFR